MTKSTVKTGSVSGRAGKWLLEARLTPATMRPKLGAIPLLHRMSAYSLLGEQSF